MSSAHLEAVHLSNEYLISNHLSNLSPWSPQRKFIPSFEFPL